MAETFDNLVITESLTITSLSSQAFRIMRPDGTVLVQIAAHEVGPAEEGYPGGKTVNLANGTTLICWDDDLIIARPLIAPIAATVTLGPGAGCDPGTARIVPASGGGQLIFTTGTDTTATCETVVATITMDRAFASLEYSLTLGAMDKDSGRHLTYVYAIPTTRAIWEVRLTGAGALKPNQHYRFGFTIGGDR
jgi:hypothetical protein